ncbi:hypothetical protein KDK_59610 [Dictyobacter kobayashii]|uniref:Uncharacterized protein n=2 Tax=Dictyobacter kobayashii TaxID=2014872 RepID=A0A402ASV5_9CHLR|nr:hypothetical protein KDK_59610 [Dictyobacter kobayashii]
MSHLLWYAKNEHLSVSIYDNAAMTFYVKEHNVTWKTGHVALQEDGPVDVGHVWLRTRRTICEEYPGHFHGEKIDHQTCRFTLYGREQRPVGSFLCQFELHDAHCDMSLVAIDVTLPSLVFPPPIETESLILPKGIGAWIRDPLPERHFWVYPAHLNMRWFGGLKGEQGWLAIVTEGYTSAGVLATGLAAAPAWLTSLGSWSGKRKIRYQFVQGGYVALAKAYRAYAIEHRLHRSLAEKVQATPALHNLHGAPLLSFMQANSNYPERYLDRLLPIPAAGTQHETHLHVHITHTEVQHILQQLQKRGITHALAVLRGWIPGGYDESHPDIWPPEPALGTLEDLKQTLIHNPQWTVALHDNYQDIYQQSASWPEGVIRTQAGEHMPGGLWDGGQAYILNARAGLAYARRNWETLRDLEPRAMFIDTTLAVQLYESYEYKNWLSRLQDEGYKRDLLQFYKEQGIVLGSEKGADFGMDLIDWLENRHQRIPGISIPLWPLVFHDAAFCTRYVSPDKRDSYGAPNWLADMLWGYTLCWNFSNANSWRQYISMPASLSQVYQWHSTVGMLEMTGHRYLTQARDVEETRFSNGAYIRVNFSDHPQTIERETIPAHDYLLRIE